MISLPIKDIKDATLRKIVELLQSFINKKTILSGDWRFVELTFSEAVTDYKLKHSLSFTPKDVIQLSVTGSGTVTWLYSAFDETYAYLTTTAACTVRAYIGRHMEG